MTPPSPHRVSNSMLWAAWADALGFISEFASERDLRRRVGTLDEPVSWRRRIGGRYGAVVKLPAGTYSDDTQLRLAAARAISANGFDIDSFSKVELTVWPTYALGGGRASRQAAKNLAKTGVRWFSNFYPNWTHSGGNGVAMRIQPHVYTSPSPTDPASFIPDVLRDGMATHGHPRALVGAIIQALALGFALKNGRPIGIDDIAQLLDQSDAAIEFTRAIPEFETTWRPAWEKVSPTTFTDGWHQTVNECREAIRTMLQSTKQSQTPNDRYGDLVHAWGLTGKDQMGSGTLTSLAAVLLAAWCPTDAAECSRIAARALHTDTDTIATMAASIVGANCAEPPHSSIMDQTYLEQEAQRLHDIAARNPTEDFQYPPLTDWRPPSSQLDSVGTVANQVVLAGLGTLDTVPGETAAHGNLNQWAWQWYRSDFGPTVLAKQRLQLDPLPTKHHPHPARRVQVGKSANDIERMTSWVRQQIDRDDAIGYAVRRIIQEGTPEQLDHFIRTISPWVRQSNNGLGPTLRRSVTPRTLTSHPTAAPPHTVGTPPNM